MRPGLEVGDVAQFGGRRAGVFGTTIKEVTQGAGEQRTVMFHVGQICGHDAKGEPLLGESSFRVRIHAAWPEIEKAQYCEIWRKLGRSKQEKERIRGYWQRVKGRLYGGWKLVIHAMDGVLGWVIGDSPCLFRRCFFIKKWTVCSAHVGLAEWAATEYVLPFGLPAGTEAPDDIHDYMKAHPEQWVLVWRTGE